MIRTAALSIGSMLLAEAALAVDCTSVSFKETQFTICEVDATQDKLELFLRDESGKILGQFSSVNRLLQETGQELSFAMNAGMYHEDRAPVGHYKENGIEVMRVIPNAGPGNFGLLPNGVLCLRLNRADVFETLTYLEKSPDCIDATQSGPMLVIDGALHPRFLKGSTSTFVRNGVGTSADGKRAVFAISDEPVNFYNFGLLFRDYLKLPNALYLDGNISRLYAPAIGRSDFGFALGPIIGVVEPLPK